MAKFANKQATLASIDNRKHQRLPIEIPVVIHLKDGADIKGITKNISFSGAYIQDDLMSQIAADTNCTVTLILQDGTDPTMIKFKATIIHSNQEGIGVEFNAIFAEDYNEFVYLMVNNSPDPDGLLAEVSQHPGIKIQNM